MASAKITAALRDELEIDADRGAGILELIEHLHASNRRLARRDRLSRDQLDELSLYCWTLKSTRSTPLMWDRSDGLWSRLATSQSTHRRRAARH
jgi:hypothetical protein